MLKKLFNFLSNCSVNKLFFSWIKSKMKFKNKKL